MEHEENVAAIAVYALKAPTSGADHVLSVKNEADLVRSAHGSWLSPINKGLNRISNMQHADWSQSQPGNPSVTFAKYVFWKSGQCLKISTFKAAPVSGGVNGSPSCFPNSAKFYEYPTGRDHTVTGR